MLTSAACVSSAIDKSLTPVSYYKKYPHGFVYDSIPKMTNNKLQITNIRLIFFRFQGC